VLQFGQNIELAPKNTAKEQTTFGLKIGRPEDDFIVARASKEGPVLGNAKVEGFHLWSGFETAVRVVTRYEDGSELVEMGVVMSPARSNVVVKVELQTAGVLFEDGTTVLELKSSDFDELGRAKVRFLRAAGTKTSVCHRTKAYQDGKVLGTYP